MQSLQFQPEHNIVQPLEVVMYKPPVTITLKIQIEHSTTSRLICYFQSIISSWYNNKMIYYHKFSNIYCATLIKMLNLLFTLASHIHAFMESKQQLSHMRNNRVVNDRHNPLVTSVFTLTYQYKHTAPHDKHLLLSLHFQQILSRIPSKSICHRIHAFQIQYYCHPRLSNLSPDFNA